MIYFLAFFLPVLPAFSYIVGNFSEPTLYKNGAVFSEQYPITFRTGYLSDYTYSTSMKDEFITENSEKTDLGMTTYANITTINLCNRLDAYAILGSTKMQENELGFVPRKFSWCVGGKAVLLQWGAYSFGIDGKYFETKQTPVYYVLDTGEPAFIQNNLDFTYSETQIAFGFSYIWDRVVGYLGATYLNAKLLPSPRFVVLDIPAIGEDSIYEDDNLRNNINERPFGLVWGITLLSEKTFSLNIESRHIDQYEVNVSGLIRF